MFARIFFRGIFIFFPVVLLIRGALVCGAEAEAPGRAKPGKILLVSSFNAASPWSRSTLEGFGEYFMGNEKLSIEIEAEELDATVLELARPSGETFERTLQKIKTEKPSIAVIADMPATVFFLKHADEIPREVSVIFCGYPGFLELPRVSDNFYFVRRPEALKANIDLAARLFPNAKRFAIITAADTGGIAAGNYLKAEVQKLTNREAVLINGAEFSTREMLEAVSRLSEDSVMLYSDWSSTKPGVFVSRESLLSRLARTNVPVLTTNETGNADVLGGMMADGVENGRAAARFTEKILAGETVPRVAEGRFFSKFNYPALEKFGISEKELPQGCVISGKTPSFWFTYRYGITSGTFLALALTVWIVATAKRNNIIRDNAFIYGKFPVRIVAYDKDNYLIFNHSADAQIKKLLKDGKKKFHLSELPDEIHIPFLRGLAVARASGCEENVIYHCVDSYRRATFVKLPEKRFGKDAVMIFSVDITDLEKSKLEITRAMEAAQAADKAKSLFIATVSHELRTPLNAVIGYSELSQDRNLPADTVVDNLKSINSAANALLSLINDVLDISRLEAGRMEITKLPVDLNALLSEVMDVFKFRAAKQKITLERVSGGKLPTLLIDPLRIKQVFANIIGNAVKFTDRGSVRVEADFAPGTGKTGTLQVKVSDTGMGIAPEYLQKIFNAFERQPANRAKGANVLEGTGLGLAISQRLIKQMNGEIRVESDPGKGSTFTILLSDVEISDAKTSVAPVQSEQSAGPSRLPVGKVMITDDIEMNLNVLAAILKKIGMNVMSALSAVNALEQIKAEKPAIILTDLWMPEMDGELFARKIRETPELADIPIVAVTADTQMKDPDKVFDDVLLKPVTIEKVRNALEKFAGAKRAAG